METKICLSHVILVFVYIISMDAGFALADKCRISPPTDFEMCVDIKCYKGDCQYVPEIRDGGVDLVIRCECKQGWTGVNCNLCCSMSCAPGRCQLDPHTRDMFCNCSNTGYTGVYCHEPLPGGIATNVTTGDPRALNDSFTWTTTSHAVVPAVGKTVSMRTSTIDDEENCTRSTGPTSCYGTPCINGNCTSELIVTNVSTSIVFSCQCHPGWIGSTTGCTTCCPLVCEHGNCEVNKNGGRYCQCNNDSYTGKLCDIWTEPTPSPVVRVTETPDWVLPVVITSIGAVILASVCAWMIIYYLWKKREPCAMRIIRWFQKDIDPSTDGKKFDVFISYRASQEDEHFVVHTLHPILAKQKMNFDVCIHYKDFIPGGSISENIIAAVEQSRRTLLVISPDYVSGDFPRFEYEVAQREMLKNYGHRIIPVIYRKIDDVIKRGELDLVLKNILDSVTYLEWPGTDNQKAEAKFWERLELSMPKRKKTPNPIRQEVMFVELEQPQRSPTHPSTVTVQDTETVKAPEKPRPACRPWLGHKLMTILKPSHTKTYELEEIENAGFDATVASPV